MEQLKLTFLVHHSGKGQKPRDAGGYECVHKHPRTQVQDGFDVPQFDAKRRLQRAAEQAFARFHGNFTQHRHVGARRFSPLARSQPNQDALSSSNGLSCATSNKA